MSRDLLVEIGTEELPPKSLDSLRLAFAEEMGKRLTDLNLNFDDICSYASPRRLALLVKNLDEKQPDKDVEVLGPPVANAFDAEGNPNQAALGFAKRCGCEVDELQKQDTEKGQRLAYIEHQKGSDTSNLIAPSVESSLRNLPVARWMRWGSSRTEFVRPLHWVLCLFGEEILSTPIFGLTPGNATRGHRFLASQELTIDRPDTYLSVLREEGKVLADSQERQTVIRSGVEKLAKELGGIALIDDDLLAEVTALVEFPEPMLGSFDDDFLSVPPEALISSMQGHQKYFPVTDRTGKLLARFIFVSNISSPEPQKVIEGNERVIRPRLADARFFFESDKGKSLQEYRESLKTILYQKQLGSLFDKTQRIADLSAHLAEKLGANVEAARHAGELCKSDLASDMVQEFDDLQGIMGRYYALESGESAEIADAIQEHYLPRHASDNLPVSEVGTCVALADRLDSLTGIFGIGQSPTGSKDPFALRRASLAMLRMIIEKQLHLPLRPLIERAASAHANLSLDTAQTTTVVFNYSMDRLPAIFQERGISIEPVRSVLKLGLDDVTDIVARVDAVTQFMKLEASQALASANKRVSNLMEKSGDIENVALNPQLFEEAAETKLSAQIDRVAKEIDPLLENKDYGGALIAMAALREPVDQVFDKVMIMAENLEVRANRLALLSKLRALFLRVADISELPSESS